jgi:hypothetical protein
MRLVFIYGPPGVGKLTVARELAALTGLKLFHNHLTVDLVSSVFPRGHPSFGPLVTRFRCEVFTEAARAGVDLIFTYVYSHPEDESDVRTLVEPVIRAGGTVNFVRLTCDRDELLTRVASESRRAFRKLNDPATVANLMAEKDLTSSIPIAESLTIDTTQLAPEKTAAQIAAHHSLPMSR